MEYTNTDVVPENGEYRCTACGDVQEFEAGDDFTLCDSCGNENAGWDGTRSKGAEEGLSEDEVV